MAPPSVTIPANSTPPAIVLVRSSMLFLSLPVARPRVRDENRQFFREGIPAGQDARPEPPPSGASRCWRSRKPAGLRTEHLHRERGLQLRRRDRKRSTQRD